MPRSYRFANAELQPAQRLLAIAGKPVTLGGRAFDILVVLVERAGQLVSKNELLDAVWGKLVVEEGNLHVHISALRKLLGSDAIATVPGRGYRFTAPLANTSPAAAPPALSAAARPSSRLVGRDSDLALLGQCLREERLITLTGPGGVGKTTLAQTLLQGARDAYRDGAAMIELAEFSDLALLPSAVATAMDLPLGAGAATLATLAATLRPLELLLVLDNAEHLLPAAAAPLQELLDRCPGLHLLVTSQAALGLAEERVYRLDALALPPPDAALRSPEEALSYSAVALFCARARAADRRFVLRDDDLAVVSEIVRKLDGLPLAIELAAARLPLFGLSGLAARLDERLRALRSVRSDAPARQQTLAAAMVWSYGLLNAEQAAVFRSLGVFRGGFGLELAQALFASTSAEPWEALDLLAELVDRSLVAVDDADPPRYRLLETARAYALERLAETGELTALRERHARIVAAHFEAAAALGWTLPEGAFVARFEPELDNLRAALEQALAQDAALAIALAGASTRLWRGLSLHAEALRYLKQAATMIDGNTPPAVAARFFEGLAQLAGEISSTESRAAALRAAELYRQLKDRRGLYLALGHYAFSFRSVTPEARSAFAEMSALEDSRWPAAVLAFGAKVAGGIASHDQDIAAARAANLRRLSLATTCGSDRDCFAALGNLADIALIAGDAAEAARLGRDLLARLPRRHGVTRAIALGNLLLALLAQRDTAGARVIAEEFVALVGQLDYMYLGSTADALALLAAQEARLADAACLIAFADTAYAADEQAREPNEARARSAAWEIIEGGLPDRARYLAEGAGLTPEQAGMKALGSKL